MTAKPHDALFKAAFGPPKHAADLFRCSLPEVLGLGIDYDTFAPEPGSFIDPELADSHSDLLFSARLRGDPVLLYLLLEHQSTNDRAMPLRIYEYLARIWKRHFQEHSLPLPLIIPLVVSHAPDGWTAPTSFQQLIAPEPASIAGVAELVPSFRILVEDLAHLTNEQLRSRALSAFEKLALWLLRDARDIEELVSNAVLWADVAYEAGRAPNGIEAVALLFRYVALITDRLTYKRFRANILTHSTATEEAIMTLTAYEEIINEGQVKTLRRLLVLKFGAVPGEYQSRLEEADQPQLERFTDRILSAQTIAEVFADPT